MKKAGKLAVYTPPTIMMLMHPGPHAVASGGGKVEKIKKKPKEKIKEKPKKYK